MHDRPKPVKKNLDARLRERSPYVNTPNMRGNPLRSLGKKMVGVISGYIPERTKSNRASSKDRLARANAKRARRAERNLRIRDNV